MRYLYIFLLLGLMACGSDNRSVDLPSVPTISMPSASTSPDTQRAERMDTMPSLPMDSLADTSRPRRMERPNMLPPHISFADTVWQMGNIPADTVLTHTFKFVNTGEKPLEVSEVQVACGCTTASRPFLPIKKGEESYISVQFDSKGKRGKQQKTVTVYSNAENNPQVLTLKANIK